MIKSKPLNQSIAVAIGFLVTLAIIMAMSTCYEHTYGKGEAAGYQQGIKDAAAMPPEVRPHD